MNRLGHETSPYLLQHADNPVEWYPWGKEAIERAQLEEKPILLSIGYSACHWCHVMAHESFEDTETAELMNRRFVNVKVDREERPDLDKIYQTAHQLIHRRPGGWPLTMFLNPHDQRPYFGGTYFPKHAHPGLPAFSDLLEKAADYFRDHRTDINAHGEAIVEALEHLEPGEPAAAGAFSEQPLVVARQMLGEQFDAEYGGFGGAPKFPHPSNIDRLLRHWRSTSGADLPDTQALLICALTLTRMAEGGIYDQIGGGFCRYSVDREWTIPHFEKMLYDNGPLLALYAQLWLVSGEDLYRKIATETADWVLRDMRARDEDDGGGFYSTLDADSEGEEGRFYVWTPEEVRGILMDVEYAVFAPRFGLDGPPNFEDTHLDGRHAEKAWHLRVSASIESLAERHSCPESSIQSRLDSAREKLLAVRNARVWPGRDEKILAGWNGLMIRGLAIAARALDKPDCAVAAAGALDFIRTRQVVDGRLCASFKDGRARFDAYLDDYAFLLDATIELLQARWDSKHLAFAVWLAEQLLANFEDTERGGFFFTANDHETLIHRSRPMADDALPSGNGVAALALNRLGHVLGESRYIEAAENTLRAGWAAMEAYPQAHTALVTALEEVLQPPEVVVIRGRAPKLEGWRDTLNAVYAPRRIVLAIPTAEENLPAALATRAAREHTVAYVCRGTRCSVPIDSLDALATELAES